MRVLTKITSLLIHMHIKPTLQYSTNPKDEMKVYLNKENKHR